MKVRPEDQRMSGGWISQIKCFRDREFEEANFLITQIQQGLEHIVWDGNNTEEVVNFCLNWLNSSNERGNRDWKSHSQCFLSDGRLGLSFIWEFSQDILLEEIFINKGDSVVQAVDTRHSFGPMRCLATVLNYD